LTTDGEDTFGFFLYANGLIQVYEFSQVGIDGGDGVNHYTVPGSLTPAIINITHTSNINQSGLWVFKLDTHIIAGKQDMHRAIALNRHYPCIGPPDAEPANLRVVDVGVTEVTLQWIVTDGPDSFLVNCSSEHPYTTNITSLLHSEDLENDTMTPSNHTLLVTGLQEYTPYTCSITPRNIFGEGPTANISILTNPAGKIIAYSSIFCHRTLSQHHYIHTRDNNNKHSGVLHNCHYIKSGEQW